MIARKFKRPRRSWFWRFRRAGPPAICEERADGRWVIRVGRQVVGEVASRQAAERLIDEIDGKARRTAT
jgi:hypothetical protein